jgi:predicted  nucleic acid-binding Zn-ribbon protein
MQKDVSSNHKPSMTDIQILAEISRSIGRIEGEMKRLVDEIKSNNDNHSKSDDELNDRQDKHDERLRSVENKQYWHSGAASIIGAVGGTLLTHFKSIFGV